MLSLEQQNELREQYRKVNPNWAPATEVYADLVRQYLLPDSRILDLGCGRGGLVEQLDHPLQQMVGVDPDLQSLREHRLDLPRATAYSEYFPFAGDSFDLIFASWILEHLESPSRTFQEIRRVLRPGGIFVFITPNGRHPLALLNQGFGRFSRLQGRIVERLYGRANTDSFPTYYRANTRAKLHQLSQEQGMHLAELRAIPDPTYLAFSSTLFRLMIWFEERMPGDRNVHLVGATQRTKNA